MTTKAWWSWRLCVWAVAAAGCAGGAGGAGEPARRGLAASAGEAGEAGECEGEGPDAEHACLHAQFGPFSTVSATPGSDAGGADVSAPHTAFTVALPADGAGLHQGAVAYVPEETGDFAFFLGAALPLTVLGPDGSPLSFEHDDAVDPAECAVLARAKVTELAAGERYTLVFGPTADASALLVIEHAEGGCHGECQAVELVASKSYRPPRWSDAEQSLEHPLHFQVPAEIPVIEGNAGDRWASLTYALGAEPSVTCWYQGDGGPGCDAAAGGRYLFQSCSNEAQAGDDADADFFRLRVHHGGNAGPGQRTTVRLELEDPECHDHERLLPEGARRHGRPSLGAQARPRGRAERGDL